MTPLPDQRQENITEIVEALILAHDILTHFPRSIYLQVPEVKRAQVEAAVAKAALEEPVTMQEGVQP